MKITVEINDKYITRLMTAVKSIHKIDKKANHLYSEKDARKAKKEGTVYDVPRVVDKYTNEQWLHRKIQEYLENMIMQKEQEDAAEVAITGVTLPPDLIADMV